MLISIWCVGDSCNHTSPTVFIFIYKLIQYNLSGFMSSSYNYWEILFGNFPWLEYFLLKCSFLQWLFDPDVVCDSKNCSLLAPKQMLNNQSSGTMGKITTSIQRLIFPNTLKKRKPSLNPRDNIQRSDTVEEQKNKLCSQQHSCFSNTSYNQKDFYYAFWTLISLTSTLSGFPNCCCLPRTCWWSHTTAHLLPAWSTVLKMFSLI